MDRTTTHSKQPTPIHSDNDWQEVRCSKCGWHLFDLRPGGSARKTCPKCKTCNIVSTLDTRKAA